MALPSRFSATSMSPRHSGQASLSTRHRLITVPLSVENDNTFASHITQIGHLNKREDSFHLTFFRHRGSVRCNVSRWLKLSGSSAGAVVSIILARGASRSD